jgi:hypothetical protein
MPECVDAEYFAFNYADWLAGNRTYLNGQFTITNVYTVPSHLYPEEFDFTSTVPVAWITVKSHDAISELTWYFDPPVTSAMGIGPNPDADGLGRVKEVWVCFVYPAIQQLGRQTPNVVESSEPSDSSEAPLSTDPTEPSPPVSESDPTEPPVATEATMPTDTEPTDTEPTDTSPPSGTTQPPVEPTEPPVETAPPAETTGS